MDQQPNWYRADERGVTFLVRLTPKASKNEITGLQNGRLKIKVQKPAVEGQANMALIKLLSDYFDSPKTFVHIVSGDKSREKVICINQLTEKDFLTHLQGLS